MSNILSKTTPRFSGKRFFQFAICIWALVFSASLPAQETQEKVEVNDVTRHFVLHLPPGYKADQRYPVVILFHGRNQDADDIERITHFNQLADKNGIIALYPAAQGQWNIGVRAETPSVMPRRGMGRRGAALQMGRRISRWRRRWWRLSGRRRRRPKRRSESGGNKESAGTA
jgi:hypothetical protein